MAVNAVPAPPSQASFVRSAWFRILVRVALVVFALWLLVVAKDREIAFQTDYRASFSMDSSLWLIWMGASAAAGFVFGLAVVLPFGRIRYRWSRLLLAAIPIVPLAHFWYAVGYLLPRDRSLPQWLFKEWFWHFGAHFVLAILVGVALASGVAGANAPVPRQPRTGPPEAGAV